MNSKEEKASLDVHLKDEKVIFQKEHTFLNGPIQPGYYQFPFSFTLPNNIPSSFEEVKGKHDYAKIKYETKVVLQASDGAQLKDGDEVFVMQVYPSELRHQQYAKNFPVSSCCCFGSNNIRLSSSFDKTIYHPGETAQFSTWVNASDSNVSINKVVGKCKRKVKIQCKGETRSWDVDVDKTKYPSVSSGQQIGPLVMRPIINVSNNELSTLGSMIQSDYVLSVKCEVGNTCSSDEDPKIYIPILVCSYPQQPNNTYIQPFRPPPNYNPQVMQPFVFNLNGGIDNSNTYPNYYDQMVVKMKHSPGYTPTAYGSSVKTQSSNPSNPFNSNRKPKKNSSRGSGHYQTLENANLMMQPIDPTSELNVNYPNVNEVEANNYPQGVTGQNYQHKPYNDSSDEEMGGTMF